MMVDPLAPVRTKALPRTPTKLVCVWLTALSLLVQSVGVAAGGVLCIGCTESDTGIAFAGDPCSPARDCCAPDPGGERTSPAPADDDDRDCGCIDIVLPANTGTVSSQPAKLPLGVSHQPLVHAAAMIEPCVLRPAAVAPIARAGPGIVRLLVPSARQTVLLL